MGGCFLSQRKIVKVQFIIYDVNFFSGNFSYIVTLGTLGQTGKDVPDQVDFMILILTTENTLVIVLNYSQPDTAYYLK